MILWPAVRAGPPSATVSRVTSHTALTCSVIAGTAVELVNQHQIGIDSIFIDLRLWVIHNGLKVMLILCSGIIDYIMILNGIFHYCQSLLIIIMISNEVSIVYAVKILTFYLHDRPKQCHNTRE